MCIIQSIVNGTPQEKDLFWYPLGFNAAGVCMIDDVMGILLWNWENIKEIMYTCV